MIEIRDPKFKVGQKVKCDSNIIDNILTIKSVNRFSFEDGDYFYKANNNRGDYYGIIRESDYEIYIEKPKTVWDLKEGDYYVIANINGEVYEMHWDESPVEKDWRDLGNCFLTKEEADFEAERRKIETEMLRLGGRRVFKKGENNYYIVCDFDSNYDIWIFNNKSDGFGIGTIYFDSAKEGTNAIDSIGKDRIKKYIFGVES